MSVPQSRFRLPFLVAWILFVVSFFLPAFENYRGWQCAWMCAGWLVSIFGGVSREELVVIYYGLFTFANLGMLISPAVVFRNVLSRKIFFIVAIWGSVAVLHILSFGIWADSGDLKIGYFLWASAFIIFAAEWLKLGFQINFFSRKTKIASTVS